jgi:4-hydroxy-4-methyl-2-oxoglutarate aldolase
MSKVVKNIKRADAAAIKTLGEMGVATVHEAQGRRGLLRPYMRPIYPAAKAAGSAVTVSCAPGDNMMIHASIEVKPGDILAVTTTSESTDGMLASCSPVGRAHGAVGLVIDAVRDVKDDGDGFPVGRKPSRAGRQATPGWSMPVVRRRAHPADVLVCDVDGVVVVLAKGGGCRKSGSRPVRQESKTRERLKNGNWA